MFQGSHQELLVAAIGVGAAETSHPNAIFHRDQPSAAHTEPVWHQEMEQHELLMLAATASLLCW